MAKILILEDEAPLRQSLSVALRRAGHECLQAETGREALAVLQENTLDLAILDVHLPDISGLDVLRSLRAEVPEVPTIVITAFSSVETAVEAMKEGAREYLEKPLDLEELILVVDRELGNARILSEVEAWRRQTAPRSGSELLGQSEAMQRVRRFVEQVSALPVENPGELPTILLLGETGTGKDLLARTIHNQGPLARKPFIHINCAGLPRDLVESELFGHERGSFTSAGQAKQGLFEVAQGGTVFLDEIGQMPLELQGKLLTAIESKRVRRIGGTRERTVQVRIIAATNIDLEQAVMEETFRADLFYRLRVLHVHIPPLRERLEDIPELASAFLQRYKLKYRRGSLELTRSTLEQMKAWHWPGNVRELAHTIEQLVLTSEGDRLAAPAFTGGAQRPAPEDRPGLVCFDLTSEGCTLESVERTLIREMLCLTDGNVSDVARRLGMTRGALRHRMDKLGIRVSP